MKISLSTIIEDYYTLLQDKGEIALLEQKMKYDRNIFILNTICFGMFISASISIFLSFTANVTLIEGIICFIAIVLYVIYGCFIHKLFLKHMYAIDYVLSHQNKDK